MTTSVLPRVMHILWRGDVGGAERAVLQLALHQHARRPGDVALAFGQGEGAYVDVARERGLPVVDFAMRSGTDVVGAAHARSDMKAFDVHHFHVPEPALMLASLGSGQATRVYTHRAGVAAYSGRRLWRYRLLAQLVQHFDAVTGTNQAAAAAESLLGIPSSKVAPSFNGVDFSRFDTGASRSTLRAQRGVPRDKLLIGTAANLRRWKRIDWLIGAAATLRSDGWELWVIGDGEDRSRLERLTSDARLEERTRFLGMQPRIADWLRCLDVFVLPSGPEESFGNAVVEAMACGVPTVVSADCPAHAEHVQDGKTGIVARDRHDLAARLDELIQDPALRASIGQAGKRFVHAAYPIVRAAERFEAIYAAARDGRERDRLALTSR